MALVKFGGGIVQMSGSIAGTTHARNRYGNYARARTKPVNPNTQRQIEVRATLAFLTEYWAETLTANNRSNWNAYAAAVAMKNKLGETIKLSGFNHFIRSNAPIVRHGMTPVASGPAIHTLADQDPTFTMTCSEGAAGIVVTFDDSMAWCSEDDARMYVAQGAPQNPVRNFFGGPYRVTTSLAGSVGAPITSPQTCGVQFNTHEGQKQWVRARIVRADGRVSEPFYYDSIITA